MVFGKTHSQIIEEKLAALDRLKSWHPIFALVPHQINDGRWVWWQRCERRLSNSGEMWFYRLAAEPKEK